MSKSKAELGKKALRRESARKKAKQKKLLTVGLCILAAAAVLTFIIFSIVRQSNEDIYSGGGQSVRLFEDGRFAASLAHNTMKTGTYTKTVEDNVTIVSFNRNGIIEIGRIENNSLRIPREWDDGHGHLNILPRR